MIKRSGTNRRITIGTILSPVFIALGMGVAGWALLNIQEQAQPLLNVGQSLGQITADIAAIPEMQEILYEVYPVQNEVFGTLWIPILEQSIPIVEGTGNEELKKGAGHYIDSVLPGIEDNCVLSGHRETVFKDLGLLEIGDQLIIETSAGVFTYDISSIRIVNKDDRTVIVPTDHATLTLTTCYPFTYIGNAPNRYILTGELVTSK
jgi:sortase A